MNKIFKKSIIAVLLIIVLAVGLVFASGCETTLTREQLLEKYGDSIQKEMKGCFDFFWDNASKSEQGYGLIVDRSSDKGTASIASVGFGLTAYIIGVEQGWVTREQAQERTLKTLQTLRRMQSMEDEGTAYQGFYAHFVSMSSGKNTKNTEISSVDTAILLCGALSSAEYFGGEIATIANEIYGAVNWNAFIKVKNGKKMISMSADPQTHVVSSGCWDWYAEQLMIYVLGAGSPVEEHRLTDETYYSFTRKTDSYGGHSFIYSWFGSIFTYQFSHAWIDFEGKTDKIGTNWFENSVEASKAAYQYCKDNAKVHETFAKGGWGLTACDTSTGYSGKLGTPPRGWNSSEDSSYTNIEGTVAPCGAIGSVVFTPQQSLEAMAYYQTVRILNDNDEYGLRDSFNLDNGYIASDYIGIDKGISLLMLANYTDRTVWDLMMNNTYINNGLQVLQITDK